MSYSNVYYDSKNSKIHLWEFEDGIKQYSNIPAPLYFYIINKNGDYTTVDGRKAKRIECKSNGEFKSSIREYRNMGFETFESDVSIETKFIVDKYLGDELEIPKLNIHQLDIEVHSEEGFPKADEANYPITIITIWSTLNNKFTIFAEKDFDTSSIKEDFDLIVEEKEEDIIKEFIVWVSDEHPDIITGWNSNGFDIPYIANRTKKLLGQKWLNKLSPLNKVSTYEARINEHRTEERFSIAGISCIDMLEVYKNYTFSERDNYKLDYISKFENVSVGGKLDYEGSIADLYNNDWQLYCEYNLQDVRILTAIEDKLGFMEMLVGFCYGCRVPFEQYQKTTRVLDGAFVAELAREKIVVPDVDRSLRKVGFPGGFVAEPIRNVHDWVVSYDATSLYPSIMMGWNISPEMKVAVLNKGEVDNIYNCFTENSFDPTHNFIYDNKKWNVSEFCDEIKSEEKRTLNIKEVNKNGGFHFICNSEAVFEVRKCLSGKAYENINVAWNDKLVDVKQCAENIQKNNYCLASNGVIYDQKTVGIIPRFVKKWFDQRREFKNKMLEAESLAASVKGVNKEKYEEYTNKEKYYHLLQLNYKILINSVYGYLGTVYSRFYDFDNCVAVTTTGQSITKTVKKSLDSYFKNKWSGSKRGKKYNAKSVDNFVVYGDTDSVYLCFGKILDSIGFNYSKKKDDEVKNFIVYGKIKKDLDILGEVDKNGVQIGGLSKNDRDDLEDTGKTLQNYVSNIINKTMADFTLIKCNCDENLISFKREVVASRGIFLKAKRYVLRVLNSEGTEMDKLKATGVSLVSSNTPLIVQKAHKKIIYDILYNMDQVEIDQQLRNFRIKFFESKPHEVARPISVNNLDEYSEKIDSGFSGSVPAQVRGAYNYNNLLENHKELITRYDKIYSGNKIKFMHLKMDNYQNLKGISFIETLPLEFELHDYLDYKKHFNSSFVRGLEDIYDAIGWNMPNLETVDITSLFS